MKTFPILMDGSDRRKYPDCPASVPWEFLAPHEERAKRNHSQTLTRLAERGGLSPGEMMAIVQDRCWSTLGRGPAAMREAIEWLKNAVAVFEVPA